MSVFGDLGSEMEERKIPCKGCGEICEVRVPKMGGPWASYCENCEPDWPDKVNEED